MQAVDFPLFDDNLFQLTYTRSVIDLGLRQKLKYQQKDPLDWYFNKCLIP